MPRARTGWWIALAAAGALALLSRTRTGSGVIQRALARIVDLIEREEGLRLTAYQDFAGHWTIGYGHKILPTDPYHPYGPRRTVDRLEAIRLLGQDMGIARRAVQDAVSVPLNANQLAALTSLAYNIGATAFRNSTLVQVLNAGDVAGAQAQFARWVYAGGQVSPILVGRRTREAVLFGTPDPVGAQA